MHKVPPPDGARAVYCECGRGFDPWRTIGGQVEGETAGANGDAVESYDYRRECDLGFDGAIRAVEESLSRHGFAVRTVHDIQATLAAKGFRIKPIRIYEVDGPRDPSTERRAGSSTVDPRLEKLMPCRVNIYEDDTGRIVVTILRPTLLCRVFPEEDLGEAAAALERVLIAVLDEAVP
jgi:uncharacterized protein (DUF302 family)